MKAEDVRKTAGRLGRKSGAGFYGLHVLETRFPSSAEAVTSSRALGRTPEV
jgi:hypothetical protein